MCSISCFLYNILLFVVGLVFGILNLLRGIAYGSLMDKVLGIICILAGGIGLMIEINEAYYKVFTVVRAKIWDGLPPSK